MTDTAASGRPLRILTIGHSYTVGVNRAIAREVARDPAFEVTVGAPAAFDGDLRPLRIDPEPSGSPITLRPLAAARTRFIHVFGYNGATLRRLMFEGDFDVVHAWEEPYILAGYQIARAVERTNAAFCFRTAQSLVKRYPPPFSGFERRVLRRADGWIAGGNLVYRAMLERRYPAERGRILTLAVDTERFRPLSPDERAAVRHELGLTAPIIGFVGRLTREKGLDVLMRALEMLPANTPWNALFVGSGPYERKLRAWAARRGWSDRICIKLTRHDEIQRYLGAMDVLVAPSLTTSQWKEQFGRMVIEAFACGVPVVGSDSGEIPFVIGDAGRVVPEADAAAYARTLTELLHSPDLRMELARRGLMRVRDYSVQTVAANYREYYAELARMRRSTS
ncbi:MAG TPA: glycosyltransferase family 4 protein [Gemmatimonadaceae bacterium]|nr:glycosyltransferase family 4 protein [Gemmatimonadaceae bacterium]